MAGSQLTPFHRARLRTGWPYAEIARRLHLPDDRDVRRWDAGTRTPPDRLVTWLEAVAEAIEGVDVPSRP